MKHWLRSRTIAVGMLTLAAAWLSSFSVMADQLAIMGLDPRFVAGMRLAGYIAGPAIIFLRAITKTAVRL